MLLFLFSATICPFVRRENVPKSDAVDDDWPFYDSSARWHRQIHREESAETIRQVRASNADAKGSMSIESVIVLT